MFAADAARAGSGLVQRAGAHLGGMIAPVGQALTDAVRAAAASAVPVVLDAIDLDAVLARVDIDALIGRIDMAALLDRVDVERIVDRVDVGRIVDRVDVERIVDRVDVGRIVDRVDIAPIVATALDAVDIGAIVRESTTSVAGEAVRGARIQAIDADALVARIVDRVLFRRSQRNLAGPEISP